MKHLLKYLFCLLLFSIAQQKAGAQTGITVSPFNIKPMMPGDISTWNNLPGAVLIIAQGGMAVTQGVKPVIRIKQGSGVICGNTAATSTVMDPFQTHTFTTQEVSSFLSQCPVLKPGSYSICIQFFNSDNREVTKEVCREFTVEDKNQFCNPIQNMGPQDGKLFSENDFLAPKIFTWTPFITSSPGPVTYNLTVWEVEEGQSPAQAVYDNFPVLQEKVRGQTRYISAPAVWEKRTATYIWQVEAIDAEGNRICKTAVSSPTLFKIVVAQKEEPKDSVKENTPCGNGDFESGILDPAEWSAGFTGLAGDNSTYSAPFNTTMMPASGNPVDAALGAGCGGPQSGQNHHVIVSAGFDPNVPTLRRTPFMTIPNNYAVRLGNNCDGCGAEKISKKFTVTAAQKNYRFMYALVFQVPHDSIHNPSLWVRVYDAAGTAVPNLVYLDPAISTPMDRAVSMLGPGSYWQPQGSEILYRDWACAKIDLSSLVGQTVTVDFIINDCAFCGHYGYGYFDNFCLGCDASPPPDQCCSDTINILSNSVTQITATNMLNLQQQFSIAPGNIKQIKAQIDFIKENAADTSCMKCAVNEAAVWNFMPMNKATWNTDPPINASPVNTTGSYPSKEITWFCNKQGNLQLDLKIALPGIISSPGCKRSGKIGIRYSFTDKDCKVCEKYIIYNYAVN